jgi:manganese/iron transport system substrate-binding protein
MDLGTIFKVRTVSWLLASLPVLSLLLFSASGCGPKTTPGSGYDVQSYPGDVMPELAAVTLGSGEKLKVMATTSIVADVVRTVGGDRIVLGVLMPVGTDPHAFEPTPQDAADIADAHVVFTSGAGLETFMEKLLASAGKDVRVVPVSSGVELLAFRGGQEKGGEHLDGSVDPHTWFDPNNVVVWTRNIEHALSTLDPGNAAAYAANAEAYRTRLGELDTWIREQVAAVPASNRTLVTDHTSFSYFIRRYGFEQVGAIFPGYSTLDQPSAKELAALEDAVRTLGVKAVFVGLTVNPDLAERVAEDTGTRLVYLYTGSLSEPDGPAGDYLSLMRYDVSAICEALR